MTYTVMDDLTITPMSNISNMVLINKLNREVKDLVLEEKSVKIGPKEVAPDQCLDSSMYDLILCSSNQFI